MPYCRMFSTLSSSASVSPQVTGGLQAIDCIFYHPPASFTRRLSAVDFYARRCQISHTALHIYQPPSFIERLACLLKCELYLRTGLVNCETARSRGSTHSQSQRGSRSSSHFTGSPFRGSQFADYPLPLRSVFSSALEQEENRPSQGQPMCSQKGPTEFETREAIYKES